MNSLYVIIGIAMLGASISSASSAANHNDRHMKGAIDSTYGTLDTRRNEWREERRDNCCDLFERKSEHRYGTADDRKEFWRDHYRAVHSDGKPCHHKK